MVYKPSGLKQKSVLAVFLAAAFSSAAFAGPAGRQGVVDQGSPSDVPSQTADGAPIPTGAEELSVLQSQVAVLKAQAEIAKLKSDIRAADNGGAGGAGGPMGIPSLPPGAVPPGPGGGRMGGHGGAQGQPVPAADLPPGADVSGVMLISGYDGKFSAKIQSDGGPVTVAKGSTVTIMGESWVVSSVGSGGVDLVTMGRHPKNIHMGP
ncbi:type IV pilus biogenesis protein PilP [Ferrovum sp.]|uniref:type IV pilus biogenesis protein PilP n=1 Tax=Ferrovum sp. TaxID=2609467 RepID=UPI002630010A